MTYLAGLPRLGGDGIVIGDFATRCYERVGAGALIGAMWCLRGDGEVTLWSKSAELHPKTP